ncbi:hypothetical protein IFM47457_10924 [Aspergillus lentulus]|nr:hypothetical protein IFM47457_10924 [Aspergillus lentulus]
MTTPMPLTQARSQYNLIKKQKSCTTMEMWLGQSPDWNLDWLEVWREKATAALRTMTRLPEVNRSTITLGIP